MTVRRALVAAVATASLGLVAAAAGTPPAAGTEPRDRCTPRIRALPDLGAGGGVSAFNRHRVFVGSVDHPDGRELAAYWDRRGLHLIDTGLQDSRALDINERGAILGEGYDPVTERVESWVWEKGRLHRLAGRGGDVNAQEINDHGTIVGLSWTGPGAGGRAVRWASWRTRPQVLPNLTDVGGGEAQGINNRGTIVGRVVQLSFDAQYAVSWDRRGRVKALPDDPSRNLVIGSATSINDRGQAAGGMSTPDPDVPFMATRWSGNRVTKIGNLPGDNNTVGWAIAENGWVVGGSERIGPNGRESRKAFFWPGRGPIKALPSLDGPWAGSESNAFAVDSKGTVAGFSTDANNRRRATVWTCAQKLAFTPPATN